MPRPRVHDLDRVLDAVDSLVAGSGPAAVTIRAIGAATGVSNGAVYHAFGSRAGVLAAAWLRAGQRFLDLQNELVDQASSPVAAVAAAADAPAVFAERCPDSAKLLLTVHRAELLGDEPPAPIAEQLGELDTALVTLMIQLAVALWGRRDAGAVDAIAACIVDLPTAIVLSRNRLHSPTARQHLHAAVRAILALQPPPAPPPPNGAAP